MQTPFSITIFSTTGDPQGIRHVDKSNWSGFEVVFPRDQLQALKHDSSFDQAGVYILVGNASEESALPLRGKKRKFTRSDWVDYLCRERLGLPTAILDPILHTLDASRDAWVQKIENSYLTTPAKAGYLEILNDRRSRLFG